jgi:hypothetical protein
LYPKPFELVAADNKQPSKQNARGTLAVGHLPVLAPCVLPVLMPRFTSTKQQTHSLTARNAALQQASMGHFRGTLAVAHPMWDTRCGTLAIAVGTLVGHSLWDTPHCGTPPTVGPCQHALHRIFFKICITAGMIRPKDPPLKLLSGPRVQVKRRL